MGIDTVPSNSVLTPQLVQHILSQEELPNRAQVIDQDLAQTILRRGAIVGCHIERHLRIDRTMDRARQLIREVEERNHAFPSGLVILADEVLDSKGRFGRVWHAPKGGLWMTVILVNTMLPENRHVYPLVAGVSCCDLMRSYGIEAWIKWVNDVHVDSKKIAGILTETMIGPRSGEEYVLIGIGINANNVTFPADLIPSATSMRTLLGLHIDLELLAARLLAKLSWNLGLALYEEECQLAEGWCANDGPAEEVGPGLLIARWRLLSDSIGRRVLFGLNVQEGAEYEAEVLDVDARGGIRLRHLASGEIRVENSGEIAHLG